MVIETSTKAVIGIARPGQRCLDVSLAACSRRVSTEISMLARLLQISRKINAVLNAGPCIAQQSRLRPPSVVRQLGKKPFSTVGFTFGHHSTNRAKNFMVWTGMSRLKIGANT